jgi:hypothetical protein
VAADAAWAVAVEAPRHGYFARVVALLRARWRAITAFLLLLGSVELLRSWSVLAPDVPIEPVRHVRAILVELAFCGTGSVIGPVLAEAIGARGLRIALLTVFITFATVAIGTFAYGLCAPEILRVQVEEGRILSVVTFQVRLVWVHAMAGLLFALYIRMREREFATTRAAQAAEIDRAQSQRDLIESRLKVLQARVEPELLFGALADVESFYRRNPAAAETLLDDLIAYLRAALPQMRRDTSTLPHEIALVQAYLKVVPAGREGTLAVEASIAPALADASFPPLVLLSLAGGAAKARARRVHIEATADAAAARVAMTAASRFPPEGWSEPGLEALRVTLRQYFGESATLETARSNDTWTATLRWILPASPS